jgi:hypothetical protein
LDLIGLRLVRVWQNLLFGEIAAINEIRRPGMLTNAAYPGSEQTTQRSQVRHFDRFFVVARRERNDDD